MMIVKNMCDLQYNPEVPFDEGIALEPFLHQVSGRATMMRLNETTVCKPLNYREHFFYKSLPADILQFTPRFKGVINVNIEESSDGTVELTAFPHHACTDFDEKSRSSGSNSSRASIAEVEPDNDDTSSSTSLSSINHNPFHSTSKRIKLKRTGSLCVTEDLSDEEQCSDEESSLSSSISFNPWIVKVHKEGLKRYLRSQDRVVQKYILLENVASQFRRPCVLDLKMGTRIHGDHDDEDKKERLERKSATTTTQSLGVRLSGMQVYNARTRRFVCHDKYFGRTLDTNGLQEALHQFFHDGLRTRQELLLPVIERLRSIRDSLMRLKSYRFYASSLLIMYDGDPPSMVDLHPTAVPSVHSLGVSVVEPNVRNPTKQTSSNYDAQLEVDTVDKLPLDSVTSPCYRNSNNCCCVNNDCAEPSAFCYDNIGSERLPCPRVRTSSPGNETDNPDVSTMSGHLTTPTPHHEAGSVHVDIRMIDFAKSTHRHMDSSVVHDGPDHGYIFGLTNLIKLFEDISKENFVSC